MGEAHRGQDAALLPQKLSLKLDETLREQLVCLALWPLPLLQKLRLCFLAVFPASCRLG